MKSFDPSFQQRTALAAEAKKKALDQLRAKPAVSETELAERRAARIVREAAEAQARAEKRAARLQAEREEAERKAAAVAAQQVHKERAVKTEAERKLARDLRYAARKKR